MRPVCAVSRPVIRCVFRSQPIPQPTRWMSRLPQATGQGTPEETWLEQHFRTTDCHSNSYRVTTCSLCAGIRFRSRPLLCTTCTTWDHNKHQACSSRTPPRETDFSDVSLKTLLVLELRTFFHPSHVHLLGGFIGSPNLIIASRNGYRQSSRHNCCLPQRLANNQSVGGRLGKHNAAPH